MKRKHSVVLEKLARTLKLDRSSRRQRGVYTSLFALVLPLIIGALGLGVDVSHYVYVRGQLQNATDAAAFAGAQELNSTAPGRTLAPTVASTYAVQHKADNITIAPGEVIENVTGAYSFVDGSFTTTNVSDPAANAIRVTVQRENVPSFFARALAGAAPTQTITTSAIGVAGGTGAVACGFPVAVASCVLEHDSAGDLVCPTNLSFKNGVQSVGLTLPDGSSPVSGNKAAPYFRGALQSDCAYAVAVGQPLHLQNGNDLHQESVNDLNAATQDGANPVSIVLPVMDLDCGNNGPNYNQSANVVGFLKMKLVGARWTDAAPEAVAAACPTLGKKNICVTSDCSMIDGTPGGGTVLITASKVYLVR